jgi:membrane fusion protein (multidrug efflux system)
MSETTAATARRTGAARNRRRQLLTGLAAVVILGALAYGIYVFAFAGRSVSTDNAYVGAEVAQVTPLVSGPVASVSARETEFVKAGQPLVVLDDSDAKIAVAQAEAALVAQAGDAVGVLAGGQRRARLGKRAASWPARAVSLAA